MTGKEESQRLVARFTKNAAEDIQVHLVNWKGQVYVDLRVWIRPEPGRDGTEQPTTKGIGFDSEPLLDLERAIKIAIQELEGGVEIVQDEPEAAVREQG